MAEQGLRLFIACEVPGEAMAARGTDPAWRWSHADNGHLTLRFLGAVAEAAIPGLVSAMEQAARQVAGPLWLRLAPWGVFPSLGRARVLWLGVDGPGVVGLGHLAQCLRGLPGPQRENAFHPHLTMARAKKPLAVSASWLSSLPVPPLEWPVTAIHLYVSDLSVQAARYHILASKPLYYCP